MYTVTLYEKYARYYPEEGGFYVEGAQINNQLKFASLNEAKYDLAETKAWFEEDAWDVSPIFRKNAIVGWNAYNNHIGEGWIVQLETGKHVGELVSVPGDYC